MSRKKIVAVVAILLLLAILFIAFTLPALHHESPFVKGNLDVSTNKTPLYQLAPYPVVDFFGYQEDVTLYAHASYGGSPLPNALVSFQINGPSNKYENISFSETGVTNDSGVSSLRFKIPAPIQDHWEVIFGNWTVTAQSQQSGVILNGTTFFRVNWPVEILSVRTVDANRAPAVFFVKKGDIGVEVTLRNNNAVPADVNVYGVAFDNTSTPVGSFKLSGLEVPPGMKTTIYCSLALSNERVIFSGLATVSVSLFDNQNNPYCLSSSSRFLLRLTGTLPIYITPEDVSVDTVSLPSSMIDVGDVVDVSAVVINKGNEAENFTAVLYDNDFPVATQDVVSLLPDENRTLHFSWNSADEPAGNHSLRVLAMSVPWETNLADNSSPAEDVTLSVQTPQTGGLPRTLFLILLLILLLFLVTLIASVVYRRRKEPFEPAAFAFFSLFCELTGHESAPYSQ